MWRSSGGMASYGENGGNGGISESGETKQSMAAMKAAAK